MPLGIYKPLEKLRGLPSDEEIIDWCKRLRLCIDAVHAEANYDAATSGYQDENTLYDELSYYDEQVLVYQQAINSLAKLLPERISNVSTTIAP